MFAFYIALWWHNTNWANEFEKWNNIVRLSTFILILGGIYTYITLYNESVSVIWTLVNYSAWNIEKWKVYTLSIYLLTNFKPANIEKWGSANFVPSQKENILGVVGQNNKLKTLYTYLHNKRKNKVSQNCPFWDSTSNPSSPLPSFWWLSWMFLDLQLYHSNICFCHHTVFSLYVSVSSDFLKGQQLYWIRAHF